MCCRTADGLCFTDYSGNTVEPGAPIPIAISPDGSQILTYDAEEEVIYTTVPVNGKTEFDVDEGFIDITCVFNNGYVYL